MPLALAAHRKQSRLFAEVQLSLSVDEQWPVMGVREVQIDGETLHFPYRTYYSSSTLNRVIESTEDESRMYALAMCTRHWDGYVRQWAATELDPISYPWARAFAIQLLGEYVVEVAAVIEAKIEGTGLPPYLSFARENAAFLAITKRRATSYWDCYYRREYKSLGDYPSYRAIHAIQQAAQNAA
jgi:hypothetical protein